MAHLAQVRLRKKVRFVCHVFQHAILCVCLCFLSHPSLSYSICLPVFVYECIFFTIPSHYWMYDLFISLIIILFCLKNVLPPLLFFTLLPVLRRHLVCHFLLVLTLCVLAYSAKKIKKCSVSAKLIFTFQCISSMSSRHRLITFRSNSLTMHFRGVKPASIKKHSA